MTTEHWLTIAVIIASFITAQIAAILSAWANYRFNRPKPTPDPNQPKNRIQRRGGWLMRVANSKWLSWGQLVIIPYFIWELSRELANTAPLTRQSALNVSVLVAGTIVCLLNFHILLLTQGASSLWESIGVMSETDSKLSDYIDLVSKVDELKRNLLNTRIETIEKHPLLKNENSD